ncbi:hypothetical protein WDU94_014125 [Cyamophila willieti]
MLITFISCCTTRLILLASFLIIFDSVQCANKPDWAKPCRKSDGPVDDCVRRRITEALPHLINGYPKARIPKIDPIAVKSLSVVTGSKQVGFSLKINDCLIYGMKTSDYYKVHVDFEKKRYDIYYRNPRMEFQGQYEMDGKVLLLPIQGKGDGNMTLTDITAFYTFDYKLVPKNGLHYVKITNSSMTFEAGRGYYDLKNLFNGDKYLGTQMNNFLNDNYADLIREFGPAMADAFNQVFRSIYQAVFDMVPHEKMYPDIVVGK